jgi:hypothetical protein
VETAQQPEIHQIPNDQDLPNELASTAYVQDKTSVTADIQQ